MILHFLAICGLTFLLKESDGPFGIINKFRNLLFRTPLFGVFFYKLFDCVFCLSCHTSWIVYLLTFTVFSWQMFIIYIFAGAFAAYFMWQLIYFLTKTNE